MNKEDKIEIGLNYKLFTTSLVMISKFILEIIDSQNDSIKNKKTYVILKDVSTRLLTTYEGLPIEQDNGFIIKKVYSVLKNEIELLKDQKEELFTKKTNKNKIITIIPGIDFRLIYHLLSDADKQKLWNYIKMLFIATIKLIYSINKSKKDENVLKTCDEFETLLLKNGLNINEIKFNPFAGITNKENKIVIPENTDDINKLMANLNIDKLIDVDQLKSQLNSLNENDIKLTTDNITSILGNQDNDVKEVCGELVQNLVKELKQNGLNDLFKTLTSVSEKVSSRIDHTKLKKTAEIMGSFMEKSESELKNIKGPNGIPFGESLEKLKVNPEMFMSLAQKCFNKDLSQEINDINKDLRS